MKQLPGTGILLLAARVGLSVCLLGADLTVAVTWSKVPELGRTYSGLLATILESLAGVSPTHSEAL